MNNRFLTCPKCGSGDHIIIQAIKFVTVALTEYGDDIADGDTEWDNDSVAECYDCGWSGSVKQLGCADDEEAKD